jgi:hypothetical protein
MGRRVLPDPAEIRDQIQRLRDDVANWRILIENARDRIARLGGHQADIPPQPDERPRDERPRDQRKPTEH